MERSKRGRQGIVVAASLAALVVAAAHAEVTHYTDEASWTSAAGAVTKVGVPDVPLGYPITTFLPSGLDMSGTGFVGVAAQGEFHQWIADIWGIPTGTPVMIGGSTAVMYRFTSPVNAFAIDAVVLGLRRIRLYLGSTFLGTVGEWSYIETGGLPSFYGLTSTVAFDGFQTTVLGGQDLQYTKHIMFTQIVPAPGAIALLALAPVACARRRR